MPNYLGSKAGSGVYQAIIALMPPHDTYIELFAGSGAVLSRKPPAQCSYAVDLNAEILATIRAEGVTKVHGDAFSFLDSFDYEIHGRTLIYADPPYLHSVRTSRHRYKHEFSDEDHFALLQRLNLSPACVILSGYPSEMYDSMLQLGWQTREFQAMTRGGVRTEKLWFNFNPTSVHYAKYAGCNFTERQRIKRKAQRWARMFALLSPGERMAILAQLLSVDPPQSPATLNDRRSQTRLSMPAATDVSDCAVRIDTHISVQKQVAGLSNSPQLTSDLR